MMRSLENLEDDIHDLLLQHGKDRSAAAGQHCPTLAGRASDMTAQLPGLKNLLRDLSTGMKDEIIATANKTFDSAEANLEEMVSEACDEVLKVRMGEHILPLIMSFTNIKSKV